MSKFIIASDLHGSAKYCKLLLKAYRQEGAEKLLFLGDLLYHGPRNPLPEEYDPQKVISLLSEIKEDIICVRGNCDAEVDQMVAPFRISSDYAEIFVDGLRIVLSHGHREIPPLCPKDAYITGHTHVPLKETGDYIHLNPGSLSLPKEGSAHSYILYENKEFTFKNLETLKAYDKLKI